MPEVNVCIQIVGGRQFKSVPSNASQRFVDFVKFMPGCPGGGISKIAWIFLWNCNFIFWNM